MIGGWEGRHGGEGKSEQESSYVSYNWLILERMPRCEANSSELGLAGSFSSQDGIASQSVHTTPQHHTTSSLNTQLSQLGYPTVTAQIYLGCVLA